MAQHDAHAGAGIHLVAVHVDGLAQQVQHAARKGLGAEPRTGPLRQHRELVAAVACHQPLTGEGVAQAPGDLQQQLVAGGMPEAVVHQLEAVQVEEQHGVFVARAGDRALQAVAQLAFEQYAVGQPGQGIVSGIVLELALEAPLLGHIADRAAGVDLAVDLHRTCAHHDLDACSVLAQQHHAVVARGQFAGLAPAVALLLAVLRLRRHQQAEVGPDQLLFAVAEHRREGLVHVGVAVGVHHVDADLTVLDQIAVARLGLLQAQLRLAPRGDVLHTALEVRDATLFVAHGVHRQLHPHELSVAAAHLQLVPLQAPGLADALQQRIAFLGMGVQIAHVAPRTEQLGRRVVAEQAGDGRIGLEQGAVGMGAEQTHHRVLEQFAVLALGLGERALAAALLGDVARRADAGVLAFVFHRVGAHRHEATRAVLAQHFQLVALALQRARLARGAPLRLLRTPFGCDQFHVLAVEQLRHGIAEDLRHGQVEELDLAVLDEEDAVAAVVHQDAVERLGLAQARLGLDALGDVHYRALVEKQSPRMGIAHGAGVLGDPDQAAVAAAYARAHVLDETALLQLLVDPGAVGRIRVKVQGAARGLAQHLQRRVVAEDARHGRIEVDEAAIGQAAVQAFGGGQEQGAVALHVGCRRVGRRRFAHLLRQRQHARASALVEHLAGHARVQASAAAGEEFHRNVGHAAIGAQLGPDAGTGVQVGPQAEVDAAPPDQFGARVTAGALQGRIGVDDGGVASVDHQHQAGRQREGARELAFPRSHH